MFRLLFLLLTAILPIASAAAAPETSIEYSAEEVKKLEAIRDRGKLLYLVDRAAWVTTDTMREKAGKDWRVTGWVVEKDGQEAGAFVVTYYGPSPDGLVAYYVGRVRDEKVVSDEVMPSDRRPPLTAAQIRIVRAIEAALREARKEKFSPCTSAPFNVAAIATDATIDVYFLSAQTQHGVYPAGGHYLVRVDDNGRVRSSRRFTRTCIALGGGDTKEEEELVAVTVTHLLDPIPTEIHVFLSIWMRLPVMVGTSKPSRIWMVRGSIVELLDDKADVIPVLPDN